MRKQRLRRTPRHGEPDNAKGRDRLIRYKKYVIEHYPYGLVVNNAGQSQGLQEEDMDQTLGKRKRHRFAIKGLTISLNGKNYRIVNINEFGVGFLIDSPEEVRIGTEIAPMVLNAKIPVRVAGVPRHISQFRPSPKPLFFKSGWVCGAEFTLRHYSGGNKLLREFIAENIDNDVEETEN